MPRRKPDLTAQRSRCRLKPPIREGVTIHTARFHLRTALTRTGTKTQADLVRSAVRLLRDMALRG
jgi:hypothetical protein